MTTTNPPTLPHLTRTFLGGLEVWRCCPRGGWVGDIGGAWDQHGRHERSEG